MRGKLGKVPKMELKYVDIHDVAKAHVRSLFIKEAAGNRFIVVSKPMWLLEIVQILNQTFDGKNSGNWNFTIPVKEYSIFEVWIGSWFDGNAANAYHYWNK